MSQHYILDTTKGDIDRTMPGMLEGHITPWRWSAFCDDLEELALKGRRCARLSLLSLVLVFAACAFAVVRIYSGDPTSSSGGLPIQYIVLIIAAAIFGVSACCEKFVAVRIASSTKELCKKISEEHQSLSFQYEYTTQSNGKTNYIATTYIRITVNDGSAENIANLLSQVASVLPPKGTTDAGMPIANIGNPNASAANTTAMRMADLEAVRSMISVEEYEQKKKEILDSL